MDQRIPIYTQIAKRLKHGDFDLQVPVAPHDEVGQLGAALLELARTLETRYSELYELDKITTQINAGLMLDDVLENIYQNFRDIIPYNRIGFSLLENKNRTVCAYWAKSDQPDLKLVQGYKAPLAGSSLETIITTGQPRILNNLLEYLEQKPHSESTRLIVAEGMRASLTCPLIANGIPMGFMFFSSTQPYTYAGVHIDIFNRIAGQLSVILEKGRLVSELAVQKNAIETQNQELRRLNELKNTFLGMAAHDLRNPIGYIQMVVNLLADPPIELSNDERQKLLQDANRQTEHMLTLLNELLDVTQIEAGKLELRLELFNLNNFIVKAIEHHSKIAASKGTKVHLDAVPRGKVMADPHRLRQVIDNLISNAVKYSPAGSNVQISVQRTPSAWRVSVQDEGPGITSKDRQLLFQDFARLSARPTGGEKSTGLGLAITRRIVEAHGGQIGVESEPRHGANFWFTLPLQLNDQHP
jgi:signal transduction histidine kinase